MSIWLVSAREDKKHRRNNKPESHTDFFQLVSRPLSLPERRFAVCKTGKNPLCGLFSHLLFHLTEDLTSFNPVNRVVKATGKADGEIAVIETYFVISAQRLNRNHVTHKSHGSGLALITHGTKSIL